MFPFSSCEGVIQPDGEPLASQFVPKCYGVVQKVIVQEEWKVWNATRNTWLVWSSARLIHYIFVHSGHY